MRQRMSYWVKRMWQSRATLILDHDSDYNITVVKGKAVQMFPIVIKSDNIR